MDRDTIEEIITEYSVAYRVLDNGNKGLINYDTKNIYINPMYNEDADTLMHELYHHYYDNVLGVEAGEDIVEQQAQEALDNNPCLRCLLETYIEMQTMEGLYDG